MSSSVYEKVIIVTGIIGSGKSTVCQILEDLGYPTVSADILAREILSPNSPALQQVRTEFGDEFIQNNRGTNELNRALLAEVVFNNPSKLKLLENITHPKISEMAKERFLSLAKNSAKPVFYDCPLYFETALTSLPFKSVVLVIADRDVCIRRVVERSGITQGQAELRLDAQIPLDKKIDESDFIIQNNGDLKNLEEQVKLIIPILDGPT